jgi:hypothetical protein
MLSLIFVYMCNVVIVSLTEIGKVRGNLFQINGGVKEPLNLPEPSGETVSLSEKVYVPVKEHPDVSTLLLLPSMTLWSPFNTLCTCLAARQ